MEVFTKSLILALTLTSALAQYEGYDFDQHGLFQPPYHKQPVHQALELHGHEDLEYHGHQQAYHKHEDHDLDFHAHPKYAFDYSVKDPHTGDDKEHWETRDGDKVKGSYTLIETDGTKRVVEYEADDKNGFNAVVHKIGTPKEQPAEHKKPLFEVNHGYEPLRFHNEPQHDLSHFDEGFQPFVPNGYH